jgi:hypothetical protein
MKLCSQCGVSYLHYLFSNKETVSIKDVINAFIFLIIDYLPVLVEKFMNCGSENKFDQQIDFRDLTNNLTQISDEFDKVIVFYIMTTFCLFTLPSS